MLIDPLNREQIKITQRLKRQRFMARLVLAIERLLAGLWRSVSWVLFFSAIWLFGFPTALGNFFSFLTAIIFVCGLIFLMVKDQRYLRWPSTYEANRRLEIDSGFSHRPLCSLDDTLVNTENYEARSLWSSGKERLLGTLDRVKLNPPDFNLNKHDPLGLRYGAAILFLIGMLVAGPLWQTRIYDAFSSLNIEFKSDSPDTIALWITPPTYTKAAQIILRGNEDEKLFIPKNSTLKAIINGGIGKPSLYIDERKFSFKNLGNDTYSLEINVPHGKRLSIKQMFIERASWDLEVLPDLTPVVILKDAPETTSTGSLRFPLMVYDDYSVRDLKVTMRLDESAENAPYGENFSQRRTILSPARTEFLIHPLYDLTAHPWAGQPVTFEFEVFDNLGQSATTPPISVILPERKFSHPVAKQIIALRKALIRTPESPYRDIAKAIESILITPNLYQHDEIVFLNLRSASARLFYNKPSLETSQAVVQQLWQTALRVEDGNLTMAARTLSDAQKALQDALNNPETTDQDIAALMQEVRQAMAAYFMSVQKEMQKRIADGDHVPLVSPEMMEHMISPNALADFLNKLEGQMLSGNRQAAQEMLAQLQRMMEALDPSMAGPMPPDMQMMSKGVSDLQALVERQEVLLEQTQAQAKQEYNFKILREKMGDDFAFPEINTAPNKIEQEDLRHILGQLMLDASDALNNIPQEMGLAEREMRASSDALGQNQAQISVEHQQHALAYLKQAQDNLSQQFMARMQQIGGMMFGSTMRFDPLGRPMGNDETKGFGGDSDVKVPSDAQRNRAREILDLLRRRSGERDRPKIEREYYRRLLRQF